LCRHATSITLHASYTGNTGTLLQACRSAAARDAFQHTLPLLTGHARPIAMHRLCNRLVLLHQRLRHVLLGHHSRLLGRLVQQHHAQLTVLIPLLALLKVPKHLTALDDTGKTAALGATTPEHASLLIGSDIDRDEGDLVGFEEGLEADGGSEDVGGAGCERGEEEDCGWV